MHLSRIQQNMTKYPTPLTPAVYHVLLALAPEPRHGYAIAAEISQVTAGELTMGPGTLYGSLRRMEGWGLVEPSEPPADAATGDGRQSQRRYYRLTPTGREALRLEALRLERAVTLARAHHVLGGPA